MKKKITVKVLINAPVTRVWDCWTKPEHIVNWNFASDDWCCPRAENDLKEGGKLNWRMEAKNGSFGFDFEGVYTIIEDCKRITYSIIDGRKVELVFTENDGKTLIIESFEAENTNPEEMQRNGWQSILNNFKKYTETK